MDGRGVEIGIAGIGRDRSLCNLIGHPHSVYVVAHANRRDKVLLLNCSISIIKTPDQVKLLRLPDLLTSLGTNMTSNIWRAPSVSALFVSGLTILCAPWAISRHREYPQVIDDSQLNALTTTIGGASVLPTTRTIPHWFGSALNPNNGVTYGYNMVGADPNNFSGRDVRSPSRSILRPSLSISKG